MASPTTAFSRLRSVIRALNVAIRDCTQERADIVTQGAGSFIAPAVDGDPDPQPDISQADVVAAAAAIQAINQTLDANSSEHRKALLKIEA